MRKVLGLVALLAIIGGAYYLVAQFNLNGDFERKATGLMEQHGQKVLAMLDSVPSCQGRFKIESSAFHQDSLWSTTGSGRLFFLNSSGGAFDISYRAELTGEGGERRVFVSPEGSADLQAKLAGLMLAGCK